jgi:hypothetical protein
MPTRSLKKEILDQASRTYGPRDKNGERKDFVATWHSLLPQFIILFSISFTQTSVSIL